jgi:hypothetical protein
VLIARVTGQNSSYRVDSGLIRNRTDEGRGIASIGFSAG